MNKESRSDEFVLLFDGVCNLCNGAVGFILKHDRRGQIKFCPLQSEKGKALMLQHDLDSEQLDTLVYLKQGVALVKSRAVISVLADMGWIWKSGNLFKIIPPVIGDFIYGMVAKFRYRVFGKREQCMVPSDKLKARFI